MNDSIIKYALHLADDTLILAQRNSEWCGHGPVLEQDIAITNISLDLIGQARSFYQYAADLINTNGIAGYKTDAATVTEDALAHLRTEREFSNCLLVEQPKGDWAVTVLRQFFYSSYQFYLFEKLQTHTDTQIAAIAEKSLKEIRYHLRWSSEWVVRLGDGTLESRRRMEDAIATLWQYTGELFMPAPCEAAGGVDLPALKYDWSRKVKEVFDEASLIVPTGVYMQTGGKTGVHTEHMGYLLTDLQYMQRAYPGNEW